MKRGEVWTAAGGADYAGKPRPVVVLQDDRFVSLDSVTICPFTTDEMGENLVRLLVVPTSANGLRESSRLMVDKVTTISKSKLGRRIGVLLDSDMARLNEAIILFLGLAE